MSKRLTIGLIGYQFMGRAHSNAYRQVNRFFDLPYQIRMKTLCGRNEDAVAKAADMLGWEGYATDWRSVIDDPEIDVVDISTPGDSHHKIAMAAAEAGKAIFCEKPIGNTLVEAEEIVAAAKKAGVAHAVFHNYRKAPAVKLAKQMIEAGELGRIYHFRAVYLQDWAANPNLPLIWRLQKDKAGSGSHGDIASHIIDLGRHLAGEFEEVSGHLQTFIKERKVQGTEEMGEVTVDDASMFLARFVSGATGTFEASRLAVGRKNHNRFEINGSKGSLIFNLERMNELEYYNAEAPEGRQGFAVIQATDPCHPFIEGYWPAGHILGYEHTFINLLVDVLKAMDKGELPSPNLEDGLLNQRVLDAVERSSNSRQWERPS